MCSFRRLPPPFFNPLVFRVFRGIGLVFLTVACCRAASVWQEGETPVSHRMHRHPWWFDQVKKDALSNGDYLSNFSREEGLADYKVTVPETGNYVLWVRANPVGAVLSWRLDGAEDWRKVDLASDPRGQQNIAADGKPDLRFIAWVRAADDVPLKAGEHTLTFRMHGTRDNHGSLDCFVLTNDGFVPNGIARPGERPAAGPGEWFPLMAGEDPFSPDSAIDLSALNHTPAGKFGPVLARGAALVFASRPEDPVKFWGCGANVEAASPADPGQARRIRYLRKFGVNAVRQHPLFDAVTTAGRLDAAKLDAYDKWFADLKAAGIYSHWSVFYHFPVRAGDGYPADLLEELEPMGPEGSGLRDSYGLITISPELQEIRNRMLVRLLDRKNPYTGLRYAEDPALAAVEYQNEDSVFFWNPLGGLTSATPQKWPRHAARLRRQFADWTKSRYGSEEALVKAWGRLESGESLAEGLRLMGPWELSEEGIRGTFAGNEKRAGDQIRFLTELQAGLFRKTEQAIRATGFRSPTITTNWLAGSGLLDQANIFTDTIGSQIDRHNYAGGGEGGHSIGEGAVYADSHLGSPGSHLFSIGLKQVEDRPFSLSEWTMCPPNRWKAEAAPLVAFYGMGLQGWDASYHFAQSGSRLGDGWPDMSSYRTDTPHYMGQFPALALAVRRGDLKEGPLVAARRIRGEDLHTGRPAWRQDYYDGERLVRAPGGTPQEVFAIGRSTVFFQGGQPVAEDLTRYWDRERKIIRSATGELVWDYGRRRVLVRALKTQAVIGWAGEEPLVLPAAEITSRTPFVSVILTSLDGQPLEASARILVTALAQDKQSGTRYSEDGTRLLAAGTAPLLLEPVQATLKLGGHPPVSVQPLDPWGQPKGPPATPGAGGVITLDGTAQAYYYEIRR